MRKKEFFNLCLMNIALGVFYMAFVFVLDSFTRATFFECLGFCLALICCVLGFGLCLIFDYLVFKKEFR